jgi:hypothetical protein
VEQAGLQRDVAQAGHLEGAAQVGAQRAVQRAALAQAEVEAAGVGIGGNGGVAWQAQVVVSEVGEQGRVAVGLSADVAGGAVALARIVEQRQPAQLRRRQLRLALLEGVELAGEGAKSGSSSWYWPMAKARRE